MTEEAGEVNLFMARRQFDMALIPELRADPGLADWLFYPERTIELAVRPPTSGTGERSR
ncbi:MAG: hypothetical protein ACRDXD_02325 [Acidimicrobiia bacterium]